MRQYVTMDGAWIHNFASETNVVFINFRREMMAIEIDTKAVSEISSRSSGG